MKNTSIAKQTCVWCDKCRHKGLCNSFIIYFQINEPNLGSFSLISEFSTKEGWSESNETQNAALYKQKNASALTFN